MQNVFARVFDQLRGGKRGGVGGVRVAEDMLGEKFVMASQLRIGIQPAAGVIEVDMPAQVEAGVVGGAQVVDDLCGGVGGIGFQEIDKLNIGFFHVISSRQL